MSAGVLIPTGRKMKSYACMRSLNRRGIRTIVASEYDWIPHFSSRYCSERVRLASPPDNVPEYRDELLELAQRPDVKTVIPVRERDVYIFAKYEEEFEEHVSLVTPSLALLRKAHDRLWLSKEAEKAGVPRAETRLLSEVDEWNTDVVVKSRYNLLTSDYIESYPPERVIEKKQILFLPSGSALDAGALRETMEHDPIVQEFIPQADKLLYCALWDHGEPLATYQHRQIRQNSWVGGGGVYRKSVHLPEVEETAYELLSHLQWHGFACIEYLKDDTTGQWKFLEVNPRIWQSLPEAVRAKADFPYYYWLCAQGTPELIDPAYERGKVCHIAYGEIAHLLSVLRDESPFLDRPSFSRTMWEIGSSMVRHPRFDYIRLDDPRFFLGALRATMSSGVTASRQYSSAQADISPSDLPPASEHANIDPSIATEKETTE